MFVGKLIQELRKLARATTPRDSEDIVFSHGPDGFEARLRPKPKPSAPQPQQAAGDGTTIYIARTTARTEAKTYTVDIYTGYSLTGTLDVDDRIAVGETMLTPNLNDTEGEEEEASIDVLPFGTRMAVVSRIFPNPDYVPGGEEPQTLTRYFPIEHVGLI